LFSGLVVAIQGSRVYTWARVTSFQPHPHSESPLAVPNTKQHPFRCHLTDHIHSFLGSHVLNQICSSQLDLSSTSGLNSRNSHQEQVLSCCEYIIAVRIDWNRPIRNTPVCGYKSSDSFSASIFCIPVLLANPRSSVLSWPPTARLNTIQYANIRLTLGHSFIITSSRHSTRLLLSALPYRSLRPARNYRCATMAQAALFTNGTKASASESLRASPAASTPTAGTKRKRANEQKIYAVREGKRPGIYNTWEECLSQVTGHKGASCRFFWLCGTISAGGLTDRW
jgi:hypothetical protein